MLISYKLSGFLGFCAAFSFILFPFNCTLIELDPCFTYDQLDAYYLGLVFFFPTLSKWPRKTLCIDSVVSSAWENMEILFLYFDSFHKMGQQEMFVKVSLEAPWNIASVIYWI
jgi:hypothetical protein